MQKLQIQLDQADRRNAELRKELEGIQAELKAFKTTPAAVLMKKAQRQPPPSAKTEEVMMIKPLGVAETVRASAPTTEPSAFRTNNLLIVSSGDGQKLAAFNTETNETHTVRMSSSNDTPLQIRILAGPGVVALQLKGRTITRIAAASDRSGLWRVQELREPVVAVATPIVGPGVAAYQLGDYVYAFSATAQRWDVVKRPDNAKFFTPIVSPGSVEVRGGGHIFTFSGNTGKWTDLDLNKILDSADEPEKADATPSK